MKLSELKEVLLEKQSQESFSIQLESGEGIDPHFHITEVGMVTKNFIDCGAKIHTDKKVSLQLWHAQDFDHRLSPKKLLRIIESSEETLYLTDEEVEVEFQMNSLSKFNLEYLRERETFVLKNQKTNCLAMDQCGIPVDQWDQKSDNLGACAPGSGCC